MYNFNLNIDDRETPRGRPKARWPDSIKHDLHSAGINTTVDAQVVCDRSLLAGGFCKLTADVRIQAGIMYVTRFYQYKHILRSSEFLFLQFASGMLYVTFHSTAYSVLAKAFNVTSFVHDNNNVLSAYPSWNVWCQLPFSPGSDYLHMSSRTSKNANYLL